MTENIEIKLFETAKEFLIKRFTKGCGKAYNILILHVIFTEFFYT